MGKKSCAVLDAPLAKPLVMSSRLAILGDMNTRDAAALFTKGALRPIEWGPSVVKLIETLHPYLNHGVQIFD